MQMALSVWIVYFNLSNWIFQEWMGVCVHHTWGNISRWVERVHLCSKLEIQGRRGSYMIIIPCVVGVWIFSGSTFTPWTFIPYRFIMTEKIINAPGFALQCKTKINTRLCLPVLSQSQWSNCLSHMITCQLKYRKSCDQWVTFGKATYNLQ